MGKVPKKKSKVRYGPHRLYDEKKLDQAEKAVKNLDMSLREAAKLYGVPRSTLSDRVTKKHGSQHGGVTLLTKEEELLIVKHVKALAEFGFPVTGADLRNHVKNYLDKKGATTKSKVRFLKNNQKY